MLFINFLCLLYLMVLSNSHTISKSIDTYDDIDEVSDNIINLDNTRHYRSRRDRIHHKYRIRDTPTSHLDVRFATDNLSKSTNSAVKPSPEIINLKASTANPKQKSSKRKFANLWRKLRGKKKFANKATGTTEKAHKRHVVKGKKYGSWKYTQNREPTYFFPENKRTRRKDTIFPRSETSPEKETEVDIDSPIHKKNNNVQFYFTPYVMYATKLTPEMVELIDKTIHKKSETTTDNMLTAIAKLSTQLNQLKQMYGVTKQEPTTQTKITTYDYPRTAEIEELLTGIKMKAIQTVVDSGPSLVNIISNTVTEATFGAGPFMHQVSSLHPSSLEPGYAVSTLNIDDIVNNDVDAYSDPHNIVTRSANNESLSISTIEAMLQKEIKSIYRKVKSQVSKELPKFRHTTTSNTAACTTPTIHSTPLTSKATTPKVTTTTATTPTTSETINKNCILSSTLKSTAKSEVHNPKTTLHYRFKTTTRVPNVHIEKSSEKDRTHPSSRLTRDNTPSSNETATQDTASVKDDYSMLTFYEQMLEKIEEDNAIRMISTANLPSNLQKKERLSKRNPETLTNIELQENVNTLYSDGVMMPDYEFLKSMSTSAPLLIDDETSHDSKSTKNYEDLSKKISYDDFVNGYKHYLKFQQEKAKADNFSAMVKYQAHRHHNVDDIGKYILDKIPQLPQETTSEAEMNRFKRFFEDGDIEDQEASTKTDDSWFRKHFYIFLDYGPPKKFHTSQIVALKPPIADTSPNNLQSTNRVTINPSSSVFIQGDFDEKSSNANKESTIQVSLDDLTRSLDASRRSSTQKNLFDNEVEKNKKDAETSTQDIMAFRALPTKMMNRFFKNKQRRESFKSVEATIKPVNASSVYLSERYKRANESIAEDFTIKYTEEKSSTPVKELLADVALLDKNKSETKVGYVDVNLVPVTMHAVDLDVNKNKGAKKSKFKDFLKKFHFKSKKTNKKIGKRQANRPPRFNPLKSIKNMFKPTVAHSATKKKPHVKKIKPTTHHTTLLNTKLNPQTFDMFDDRTNVKYKPTTSSKLLTEANELQREETKFTLGDINFNMTESLKTPMSLPIDTIPTAQPTKPLTFLMMLDDSKKNALFVPGSMHRTTRKMKAKKPTTIRIRASKKGAAQAKTKYNNELISVNVKTLRPPPSVVMKALTSIANNETLPDLNLEISKLQYGLPNSTSQTRAAGPNRAMFHMKSGTHIPMARRIIEGLSYKNHLTRIAKLSLPSKRLETSLNTHLSDDLNAPDYRIGNDYERVAIDKSDEMISSTKRQSEKNTKNVDYFQDLLVWNKDILNIDKVPNPSWKDIVKNVERDFGTTEYTTPNKFNIMNELKELNNLDMSFGGPPPGKKTLQASALQSEQNNVDHSFDNEVIKQVAMNDKAMVTSKNVVIKGEQQYFEYQRPKMLDRLATLPSGTIELPSLFDNKPKCKNIDAPVAWTSSKPALDFTLHVPISWSKTAPKEPVPYTPSEPISFSPPEPPPSIWTPDRHIAWSTPPKKPEVTWKIQSPITWASEAPATKPPEDYISKIMRKFYIGGVPKPSQPNTSGIRLPLKEDIAMIQNKGNIRIPHKSGNIREHSGIIRKYEKSKNINLNGKSKMTANSGESQNNNKLTDLRKDINNKDTPALMIDTTLLSYDDEVETVTNGIDVKKLSRNPQNLSKSGKHKHSHVNRKPLVNVVAKTSRKPQMYYSTPLPMKPSDFNKFLKEQGMDVESVISPIYGPTTLYHAWHNTSPKPLAANMKKSAVTSSTPLSPGFTKFSNIFSKYSTQVDKLIHKPEAHNKSKVSKAKVENLSVAQKAKNIINHRLGNNRTYHGVGVDTQKRIKKMKLFRQKYNDLESTTKPTPESGSEEKFSPELQTKLEHIQEPAHTKVSKPTTPKSNPQFDAKLLSPKFVSEFEKSGSKTLYASVAKQVNMPTAKLVSTSLPPSQFTEKTTLVSTLDPETDDSVPDLSLDLTGSIIFTSENPQNKDVDITIINFDDVTKQSEISSVTDDLPHNDRRLDHSHQTASVKERKVDFHQTAKFRSKLDEVTHAGSLNAVQIEDPVDVHTPKQLHPFYYLNKLRNHAFMNPNRVQISSHHYKYDIFYKNQDNSNRKIELNNKNEQKNIEEPSTEAMIPSDTKLTAVNTKMKNLNSVRKGEKKLKRCYKPANRKWFTMDSSFRYIRDVDVLDYPNHGSDEEHRLEMYSDDLWKKKQNKRFFGFYKPNLKRMNTAKKNNSPKVTKTITPESSKKSTTQTDDTTTLEEFFPQTTTTESGSKISTPSNNMPYLKDFYKAPLRHDKSTLDDAKNEDVEGFRIQIGNQKIFDAVQKIKAMPAEDTETYDIKKGLSDIPSKLGFSRKNQTKNDEFNYYLPTLGYDSENKNTLSKNTKLDWQFEDTSINTDTFMKNKIYFQYPEMSEGTAKEDKATAQISASRKFEQSIFDKSMYGKNIFDPTVYEKSIFTTAKLTSPTKGEKTYSDILTDIMSYDITEKGKEKEEVEYDEAGLLPDHVNVNMPSGVEETTVHGKKVTKPKNYIFDSASIIYNKSYIADRTTPAAANLVADSKKIVKTTTKPWEPIIGNTLSVLFRNPLEGHLGFGPKPITVAPQKPGQGMTIQVTPMPTPMEILQAQMAQGQMTSAGWPQMPMYQTSWPQLQGASMGFPLQTGVKVFNNNETYGIYMEPGVLNYDFNQQLAPLGREPLYVDLNYARSKKKNVKPQHMSPNYKLSKHSTSFKSSRSPTETVFTTLLTKTFNITNYPRYNLFTMCVISGKISNVKSKKTSTGKTKNHSTQRPNTPSRISIQHNKKRDVQAQDTYTAKDVAALEVIVDLMKNTLGYEEKDLGSMTTGAIHPMKSIHQGHDTTNSIQVHIAIPYDMQNSKKRSAAEPMRVRKIFSAKMSTPVDLEYQVHSFEGTFQTPTTVASAEDGLSPGMYLLIDRPKNGYALKPVKANIDFAEIKSRQAGDSNVPILDFKSETTLQGNVENIAKVTLSKNFISAVNKQLVELYDNLTKGSDDQHMRLRRNMPTTKAMDNKHKNNLIKIGIDWDAVKRYFGYERICNCKCKANKPMCRACAASDAVIEELIFEFDNLGKYMNDHCTEIQTYFWVNPSGGLKLRDAVDRIGGSLHDYAKRSKGKCQGRTCEALGNHIEKRQFLKRTEVEHENDMQNFLDNLFCMAEDLNKVLVMKTCYNNKLVTEGSKLMHDINTCIAPKAFDKRSETEGVNKKFVKNVYSLDNINVNIICNPEISSSVESFETSTTRNVITLSSPKMPLQTFQPESTSNFFDFEFENFKNKSKRKGLRRFFLKKNNKKEKFSYYTTAETKPFKMPFKRAAEDMPLIADSGGTFWLEYLRGGTTNYLQNGQRNDRKFDVTVIQTNDLYPKTTESSIDGKENMNILRDLSGDYIKIDSNTENKSKTTTHISQSLSQLLNLIENLHSINEENNGNFSVFSEKLDTQQTLKIKSIRPTTLRNLFRTIHKNNTSQKTSNWKSSQKVAGVSTTPLSTKTSSPTKLTSRTRTTKSKTSGIPMKTSSSITTSTGTASKRFPPDKAYSKIFSQPVKPSRMFAPAESPSKMTHPAETSSKIIPPPESQIKITPVAEIPTKLIPPTEATSKMIPSSESPLKIIPPAGAPSEMISPTDTPIETVPPTDTPIETIPPTETPIEMIPPTETPSKTISPVNPSKITHFSTDSSHSPSTKPQANMSSESKEQDTIITETSSYDPLDSDAVDQDAILSETLSPDDVSETESTDFTYSDISLDSEFTENPTDNTSPDIFSPYNIFHERVPQTYKPEKNYLFKGTSIDLLPMFNKFTTTTSITQLNELEKILEENEKILHEKKYTLTSSETESTTKSRFKIGPFFTIGMKHDDSPTKLSKEYYLMSKDPLQTENSNTEADIFGDNIVKETTELVMTNAETTQKITTKQLTSLTTLTSSSQTSTSTKTTTRRPNIANKGFFQRLTSASANFLGLTRNFYLLTKTRSSFGHLDNIDHIASTPSMKSITPIIQFEGFSHKPTYETLKLEDDHHYDGKRKSLKEQYKNVLLSIIQHETNKLNEEWHKVAYANNNDYGNKRSVTLPGGRSWATTMKSVDAYNNKSDAPEDSKKKGLFNKLASKMGLNVASIRKKAVHSPSSNFPTNTGFSSLMVTDKMAGQRQATSEAKNKMAKRNLKKKPPKQTKQIEPTKTTEASQVYPPSHSVCDLQATFNHILQRRKELTEKSFEAYVMDFPCHKYRSLPRTLLITHKSRIPKWDWIRNRRSIRSGVSKNSDVISDIYCDKFETFVKDNDGIYRMVDRKKRDTSWSSNYQLRNLPPLKPGKSEMYVMAGDSVTLDCPLQPQRSPYSQYTWGADPKSLLDSDNVHVDGFTLVIRKAGPRNVGRYSCSVDDVVRRSTKVAVVALPVIDVVFLPTYRTQRECNYDDLKAIQQLGRAMSRAARCGNVCSIRIDEPMCQRNFATNWSLIRSTGVLTMSPRMVRCSVQCRRDLFSSMLRLAIANIPSVVNTRVVLTKDGFNETLKPCDHVSCRRTTITHTLRKKDSSGHFEYHKFSSAAEPGHLKVVMLCQPGFYLVEEQHICAPCPANTSASLGDNRCSACAAGTAAGPGSATCHSLVRRLRRYDWWWYPPCGYLVACGGVVCACGVCVLLALLGHARAPIPPRTAVTKPPVASNYAHFGPARPLSPSRVILARFFKQSLPSSRGTVFDSQETRFELWKEKNIPPLPPAIDFDVDTS